MAKESADANEFVKRPRQAWRNLQTRWSNVMGDFTDDDMLSYVTDLYMHEGVQPIVCDVHTPSSYIVLS